MKEERRTKRFYEYDANGHDIGAELVWNEELNGWEMDATDVEAYAGVETDFFTEEPDEEKAIEEAKDYISENPIVFEG